MYVKSDTKGTSTPFRLDPLSKARIDWVKAQYPNLKATGSLILRRALAAYVQRLESMVADPEMMESEMSYLKACSSGDAVPWRHQPDFSSYPGKPLSEFILETHRKHMDSFMRTEPFAHIARQKVVTP